MGFTRTRLRRFAAFLAALASLSSLPGAALADPYAADPLRLVAYADHVRAYTTGEDVWEVWGCDVPDGAAPVDPGAAAGLLDAEVGGYFRWLSAGRYVPRFVAGGVVVAGGPSGWPDDPLARQLECERLVAGQASGGGSGAVVVVDAAYGGGYASPGLVCAVASSCPSSFPANGRVVVVGATAVSASGRLRTVAHEVGHTLALPHSYGGALTFLGGMVYEYDNAMDVMSGGSGDALDLGTIALNRYAAGWTGPDGARFHRGGSWTYTLSAGADFLVLPTDDGDGVFDVLGARVRSGYDIGVPAEGVEVYRVDQRGTACGLPATDVCWGLARRTAPLPAPTSPNATAHVHGVGGSFTVRGVAIEVLSRSGDGFTVRVTGNAVSERFVDDAGVHESDIELVADAGITLGCNPPVNDRYCPARPVSRAEMAAFLLRAMGEEPAVGAASPFPDVPAAAWYAPFVARLAELGVTSGYVDGTYRPEAAVTRAEMAVFLARAMPSIDPVAVPVGVFTDVAPSAWYATAVEGLAVAGVTAGCGAATYCPSDPVLRDQMGTFLARTLGG